MDLLSRLPVAAKLDVVVAAQQKHHHLARYSHATYNTSLSMPRSYPVSYGQTCASALSCIGLTWIVSTCATVGVPAADARTLTCSQTVFI